MKMLVKYAKKTSIFCLTRDIIAGDAEVQCAKIVVNFRKM